MTAGQMVRPLLEIMHSVAFLIWLATWQGRSTDLLPCDCEITVHVNRDGTFNVQAMQIIDRPNC